MRSPWVWLCWLGLLPALVGATPPAAPDPASLEAAPIQVEDTLGRRHTIQAEFALNPSQRQRGLMYRRSLAPGRGMLFVFPELKPHKMWMRNTLLALDMLFLDAGGVVVMIAPRCRPLSPALIGPDAPVRAVLELAAGEAARLGLVPGARLLAPSLDELPSH